MSDAKVKKLADLSLLLLFLSGWEEESRQFPGEKIFRAWKGKERIRKKSYAKVRLTDN